MMINLWSDSSIMEKLRVIMFMVAMFLLVLAYFFPSAFIKTDTSSFVEQCGQYKSSYTGKFIVINGEAVPICDQE